MQVTVNCNCKFREPDDQATLVARSSAQDPQRGPNSMHGPNATTGGSGWMRQWPWAWLDWICRCSLWIDRVLRRTLAQPESRFSCLEVGVCYDLFNSFWIFFSLVTIAGTDFSSRCPYSYTGARLWTIGQEQLVCGVSFSPRLCTQKVDGYII